MPRFRRLKALLLLLAMAAPARAEDCILDKCADRAPPAPTEPSARTTPRPSGAATGDFDFYVLALSWSPGFCEQSRSNSRQCEPDSNLGFVVHGLWPQYEHGFPSDCGGPATVSRIALDRGVYPDEGLARYEWRKHGTCTGRSQAIISTTSRAPGAA